MKKLLAILLLMATSAMADTNLWFATITLTNLPVTSNGLIFTQPVAVSVLFSNNATSATVLTNTSIGGATTNLFLHFAGYSSTRYARLAPKLLGSNVIQLSGLVDQPIAFTATGNWCSIVITNRPLSNGTPIRTPLSIEGTNAARIASSLLNDLGTLPTNSFPTGAVAMVKYSDLTSVQTLQNKFITNATLGGVRITNSSFTASNSFCSNCIEYGLITTNGQNFGNAFRSPATNGTASEQFGSGAYAPFDYALAIGANAQATNTYSVAIGANAAAGSLGVAVGSGANALYSAAISIGQAALVTTPNSIAIGSGAEVNFTNSVAIGTGAGATTNNQIILGGGGVAQAVEIPYILHAAIQTNGIFKGSNIWSGDLSFPVNNNTSLANGNNADVLLTNVWTRFGGPSGAFTNAGFNHLNVRDGIRVRVTNTNGFPMAFLNESGLEATASRRIKTGTGGTVVLTNNPANAWFYYDGDLARWVLETNSN